LVNADLVAAKLAELSERIGRVRRHCPSSAAELATNRDALDLVSFNLMLAVQTCADIASHVIADEGWPVALNLPDSFQRLADHQVISRESATALAQAAGLRNIVAHGYAGIDPAMVYAGAVAGVTDLDVFAREVGQWLVRARGA
jgi:uncharacterized protein YutE (UPF0331/DUF86 family)